MPTIYNSTIYFIVFSISSLDIINVNSPSAGILLNVSTQLKSTTGQNYTITISTGPQTNIRSLDINYLILPFATANTLNISMASGGNTGTLTSPTVIVSNDFYNGICLSSQF